MSAEVFSSRMSNRISFSLSVNSGFTDQNYQAIKQETSVVPGILNHEVILERVFDQTNNRFCMGLFENVLTVSVHSARTNE